MASGAVETNALSPHSDLLRAFFAARVKSFSAGMQGHLQHEGRLADSGLSAEQAQGPRNPSAPEHAVKFEVARGDAALCAAVHLVKGQNPALTGGHPRLVDGGALNDFFDKGVPCAAAAALAGPLGVAGSAGLANKGFFGLGHGSAKVRTRRGLVVFKTV